MSVICSALLVEILILEVWQVEIRVKIVEPVLGLSHEVLELVLVHALLVIVTIFHKTDIPPFLCFYSSLQLIYIFLNTVKVWVVIEGRSDELLHRLGGGAFNNKLLAH